MGRTDSTGAATIRLEMPSHMQNSLIFHYNLKFYGNDTDNYDGVSLKRFVMQSVVGNVVAFRVHAPCSGALLLDIFANAVTPQEYLTGEPMKFKSVCKFKILRRAANSDGASPRLRKWGVGPSQGHEALWPDPAHPSGRTHLCLADHRDSVPDVEAPDRLYGHPP